MRKVPLSILAALVLSSPYVYGEGTHAQNSCVRVLLDANTKGRTALKDGEGPPAAVLLKSSESKRTNAQAWQESVAALHTIDKSVYGRDQVIEALATAMLAKEFVWINGEPGGAKTFLSRLMFQSALNSIPESDKRIFVLQFHKLISEGKISGFQKFSSMMKDGRYEIETSTSLVGDTFLYLIADEAEKSNPAVLNALLSVLNERKAFLGSKVVDSILASGVFTSNKTTGEFIQGFFSDRPSGEALLDRMAIKIHIPNQQLSAAEAVAMYDMVKNPQKNKIVLPLGDLEALVSKVKISDEMMAEIVTIAREFDRYVTAKSDKSRADVRYGEAESEYFPANQFSNRSVRRMVGVFKASLIAHQLMQGVPFEKMRLSTERSDLSLLAKSALYIGPARLGFKTYALSEVKDGVVSGGAQVVSAHGTKATLTPQYSPFEQEIRLNDGDGKTQITLALKNGAWALESKSKDFEDWHIDAGQIARLAQRATAIVQENHLDLSKPQFAVDDSIDRLLAKGTLKERTRAELASIKQDLNQFAEVLNQHFEKDVPVAKARPSEKLLPARSEREKRAFRRELMTATQKEKAEKYYDWINYEVKALKQRFVELDYSIEAHLTGLLSDNHLYVFGPPGGAKTTLAEVILKSELKKLNADQVDLFVKTTLTPLNRDPKFLTAVLSKIRKDKPQQFDRFLLQFHKLLPEGVLVGFPKIEMQLNEGKEEIEVSTSLASQKFIFAILDEVDKANPQTITALLSILNEREVFAGSQVIKTALRTAILTSNKMPSEFLDSYNEDRSTGEAVMDRATNKVFVSNKISTEEGLTRFLSNLEKGISPGWKGLLAVSELEPIVKQVDFESPVLKEMLAKIHEKFLGLRIKKEEDTRKAHLMDAREFPEYYVSAAGSASDRTFIKLMDQLRARFIVHQLMSGVAFKDLRTTIEMKDLGLFFEGLGYWAPQKINVAYNREGVPTFNNDSHVIETLLGQGVLDSRVRFHVEMMLEEAKDFVQVINSVVGDFAHDYNTEIARHRDLFPNTPIQQTQQPRPYERLSGEQKAQIDRSIESLAHLRMKLDLAKAQGAQGTHVKSLSHDYDVKAKEMLYYLETYKIMTREEMLSRMRATIAKAQVGEPEKKHEEEKRKVEEKKEIEDALIDGSRIKFNLIEPGKFEMGDTTKVATEITKPFEMAATQTTQVVWKTIVEEAKKKFPGQYDGLNADPSNFKGEMKPVEQVSYEDIQLWLKAANALADAGDRTAQAIMPGYKPGSRLQLPTEAQWEFVTRSRGSANGTYHFGNNEADMGEHAWFSGNSGNTTHDVAQKKPLIINGKEFYDLHGNVWEWVGDWYDQTLKGGKDPQGPTTGSYRVFRGGSWDVNASFLRSGFRNGWRPGDRGSVVGFRLVRTAP